MQKFAPPNVMQPAEKSLAVLNSTRAFTSGRSHDHVVAHVFKRVPNFQTLRRPQGVVHSTNANVTVKFFHSRSMLPSIQRRPYRQKTCQRTFSRVRLSPLRGCLRDVPATSAARCTKSPHCVGRAACSSCFSCVNEPLQINQLVLLRAGSPSER